MNYKQVLSNLKIVKSNNTKNKNSLCKDKEIKFQEELTQKFIQQFKQEFQIKFNYSNKIKALEEYKSNYKEIIKKYDSIFQTIEINKDWYDSLTYNLKIMEKENTQFLLTYYTITRLLNLKKDVKYYNSNLVQINLIIEEKKEEDAIKYVLNKINNFFIIINIPIVIIQYKNINKYSKKAYIICTLNHKNKIETILRCSLISNNLLNNNNNNLSVEMQNKFIFDIGYNQNLYKNLEEKSFYKHGMKVFSVFNRKDQKLDKIKKNGYIYLKEIKQKGKIVII